VNGTGDLVPLADRIRWMLGCRVVLVGVLFAIWLATGHVHVPTPLWYAVGWLAGTAVVSLPYWARRSGTGAGRSIAMVGFTAGLLGDGVVLVCAWYVFGGLDGPMAYVVLLHEVAVTLLASFRTGTKLAMWHSLLALIIVEAAGAKVLDPGPIRATTFGRLLLYLTVLWVSVLATACFAAVNERELRRRRYDSEVLRRFGLALTEEHDPGSVSARLARFAHEELLANRVVVVVQPCADGDAPAEAGHTVVVESAEDRATRLVRLPADAVRGGVLHRATEAGTTVMVSRLDPDGDGWLAATLPDARNLIVIPFRLEQATGALVIEHGRRSSQHRSQRVERRMVNTAEQATLHASMAIGRAMLVDRIRALAEMDGLTRLANRRRFDAVLAGMVERAAADGTGFALIMIDLDHFKRLNDQHGHLVGDAVLRSAARCIAYSCGDADLSARYGGEEFAVILDGADEPAALAVADAVQRALRTADSPVPVTASIGIGVYPDHGDGPVELIAAADAAMYHAKQTGRNRIVLARAGQRTA